MTSLLTTLFHSFHTATFHGDIRPAIPQCIEMLMNLDWSIQLSGESLLSKLMQQCDL